MKSEDAAKQWCHGQGVEIGAFKSPIPAIKPFYVDKFELYADEPTNAQYYGDATELPFVNDSLDYVASSHLFEHTANPIKAWLEWHRVLKPGGIVYMVVPDKQFTFDSPRAPTPAAHLIDDYINDVDDTDPTHIEDFVYGIDWSDFSPGDSLEEGQTKRDELAQSYKLATSRKDIINIHFHVFTEKSLLQLVNAVNNDPRIPLDWTIEATHSRFPEETPNGILLVLRKERKGILFNRLKQSFKKRQFPNYPLSNSARPLAPETLSVNRG